MQQHEESTQYGLLAEFESPDDLLAAAKETFRRWLSQDRRLFTYARPRLGRGHRLSTH